MEATPSSAAAGAHSASFESRVDEVKLDRSLINKIVMDYLICEGYPQAATNFAREANIEPSEDWHGDTMQERLAIRNCICAGNIQGAIERINDLDPEVLERHKSLHFALLRLQLIELIRPAIANPEKHMMAALQFAEETLAPSAPTSPEYLRELEETMALLIFQPGKVHPSVAHLLEPSLKSDVAKRVNEALLENMGGPKHNKLYELVRMREWSEKTARDSKRDIPARLEIGLYSSKVEGEDSIMAMDGNSLAENVAMS